VLPSDCGPPELMRALKDLENDGELKPLEEYTRWVYHAYTRYYLYLFIHPYSSLKPASQGGAKLKISQFIFWWILFCTTSTFWIRMVK